MRWIRDSIAKKFIIFVAGSSIFLLTLYLILNNIFHIKDLSALTLFWIGLLLLFLFSIFFYWAFFIPTMKIAREVKLMMTGKNFQKIQPSSIDEIGVFTYFFNKVSSNLEEIAKDIEYNKKLISELDIASDIQRDTLPKEAPEVAGLDIVANTISADEMGGDSFDIIRHEHNTYIYVGDVTGHGIAAALVMIMVNTLINTFAKNGYQTKEMLAMTNQVLLDKISSQRFMTLLMVRWDEVRKKMFYTGAGHEHLLIYRSEKKKVEAIRGGGIALRMVPNIENMIRENEITDLQPHDIILLYTDGITEAKNPEGEMFTVERLISKFEDHAKKSTADMIFNAISNDFSNFILDAPQEDDITMIIIKLLPEGRQPRNPIKLNIKSARKRSEMKAKNAEWGWDNWKKKKAEVHKKINS